MFVHFESHANVGIGSIGLGHVHCRVHRAYKHRRVNSCHYRPFPERLHADRWSVDHLVLCVRALQRCACRCPLDVRRVPWSRRLVYRPFSSALLTRLAILRYWRHSTCHNLPPRFRTRLRPVLPAGANSFVWSNARDDTDGDRRVSACIQCCLLRATDMRTVECAQRCKIEFNSLREAGQWVRRVSEALAHHCRCHYHRPVRKGSWLVCLSERGTRSIVKADHVAYLTFGSPVSTRYRILIRHMKWTIYEPRLRSSWCCADNEMNHAQGCLLSFANRIYRADQVSLNDGEWGNVNVFCIAVRFRETKF